MLDLVKFLLPIFSTCKNYGETLSRLAGFALYEGFLLALFLRQIPIVDRAFHVSVGIPAIDNDPIWVCAAIGLSAAFASRIFKLHDRISDILRIRQQFDTNHILAPLAAGVGFTPSANQRTDMVRRRDELMRLVFYKYTSSRNPQTLVDQHEIEHAIDGWSWFWWPVEAMGLLSAAIVVTLAMARLDLAIVLFAVTAMCALLAYAQYPRLIRLARPQIDAILNDAPARSDILKHFNAL